MTPALRELPIDAYARLILPLTEPLWAGGRAFDAYVSQTNELASTPYGKRHYRTFALAARDGVPLASFKRYERTAHIGARPLKAMGIGAVFTPEEQRGHGYASAMLGLALDTARNDGFDFAYLYSDIHPQFYKAIGFAELPSRTISVRADALDSQRLNAQPLQDADWPAIRRCFDATASLRDWGFDRPPTVWNWMRTRLRHGSERPKGQPVHLVARRGRAIVAYSLGVREPAHDAYVVDEYGFIDENARAIVPALLRSAAGDLRRIVGWLPPAGARELLPRGSVRRRKDAILMIAPLTSTGKAFLDRARTSGPADATWALDHI